MRFDSSWRGGAAHHSPATAAERNLGPDHIGHMMGRYDLAKLLNRKKQWKEAEFILL